MWIRIESYDASLLLFCHFILIKISCERLSDSRLFNSTPLCNIYPQPRDNYQN